MHNLPCHSPKSHDTLERRTNTLLFTHTLPKSLTIRTHPTQPKFHHPLTRRQNLSFTLPNFQCAPTHHHHQHHNHHHHQLHPNPSYPTPTTQHPLSPHNHRNHHQAPTSPSPSPSPPWPQEPLNPGRPPPQPMPRSCSGSKTARTTSGSATRRSSREGWRST
jgi:hypothetical protein